LDDIDPKLKDTEWKRKWCEAIYASWKQGRADIPYDLIDEFQLLRDLAAGRQDILQYMKILLDESDDKGESTGYMNINWDVPAIMPKFLRIVEGMLEQTDHQVVATAVDPSSTNEKEEARLDMEYRMKFKEILGYINNAMGVDKTDEYIPDSLEELELYDGAGGFKLSKEMEIEEALDYSFYISEWKETKKKLIRDACEIGYLATKDYTDQYTRKVKVRYVDPARFIGQYSRFWDCHNMEYCGEVIRVLISDLRKLNPELPEEVLRNLAEEYNGIGGNIRLGEYTYNSELHCANYDTFLVDVMDAEWMSVNSTYKTKRKTQFGTTILFDEEWGKVRDSEKKKTQKFDIKVVYKAKWIIGTDFIYDDGLQFDVPRPGKKEVELSYHLYKLPYRSLVSLSETFIHQMCLAYYKLQNAIAMAAPSGLAIEFTSLQNMALGGKKLDPLDLIKIKTQTGTLLFKSTTHKGVANVPANFRPIQELVGGIGPQLKEFIDIWEFNAGAIRDITGINQAADASSPDPKAPVTGSKMALAATNNALRPIYGAYLTIKERTAKNMSLRIQLLIKHDKEAYKGYMPVLGSMGVRIISASADVVDADYYIKYEAKPTDERRDVIMKAAMQALTPDKDGSTGINLADFLMIDRICEAGNLKWAEAFLNMKSKKNKEKQLQLQRENMQLDANKANQAAEAKEKLLQATEKVKTDEALRLYEGKKMIDEKYAQAEQEREKELIQLKGSMGLVQTVGRAHANAEAEKSLQK
jgi:hypothetical protein